MKQDDIEKILQQYGANQRQQQQVADNLHKLARQQKRRALMVCSVVLLATTTWSVLHFATPQQAEDIIVAQQHTPSAKPTPSRETMPSWEITPQSTQPTSHHKTKHSSSSTPTLSKPQIQQEYNETPTNTDSPTLASTLQSLETDPLQTNTSNTFETPLPDAHSFDSQEPLLAENTASHPSTTHVRRFHFTASVAALALPRIGNANGYIFEDIAQLNSISGPSNFYFTTSPSSALAANVGVNYSIPLGKQQDLEVGVGLSGYSHQAEFTTYNIGATDNIDGIEITELYPDGEPERHITFSLYASLPFTFNFRPLGKDIGWNLSLTPSHSIVTSSAIRNSRGPILNPWRLTMGVGIALPRGFIRRLSITANLLSLYTLGSLHEIGIEIGF